MRAVSVKALKAKLSEYLSLVAAGETVLITDRDRVVAELGPARPGRAEPVDDALLADAMRRGWLTPRVHARGTVPLRLPIAPLDIVLHGLVGDREDR